MDKNDGAKSGNVAQTGATGSGSGNNMVAPGTAGAIQIPRDAFEANTKAYFDNLHAKDKATK
ncbi:uncharacterized protein LOC108850941 [Raphanus sativus]|uniref:Uncharacterized protein LOC108850941 n=1 Tax=Raphanus sativus TaxID=3726 RepID=A0A6J0N5F0_RAPSA|nr:uncharacterized protein LOC108850941 [Raphanus sativus]